MWRRLSSVPDYQWPQRWMSAWNAPWRWLLGAVFHVCWWAGRAMKERNRDAASFKLAASPFRSFLVIRTDGIGDNVLFEPALASLKQRFADHKLVLWAPAPVCELLSHHPAVAACKIIPRGAKAGNLLYFSSFWWRAFMGWRLGRSRFDVAIYAVESPEPLGNWLLRSVRADEKWYVPGDLENQFDWQRQHTVAHATKLIEPLGRAHELARNAHLASQWGSAASATPRIHAPTTAAKRTVDVWRTLARSTGASQLVGIMTGSATKVNDYPIESWASVIASLWRRQRVLCIFFGGADDAERLNQITHRLRDIP